MDQTYHEKTETGSSQLFARDSHKVQAEIDWK